MNAVFEPSLMFISRVTQRPTSTRIHYEVDKSGNLIFLTYYGEGEHDVAL